MDLSSIFSSFRINASSPNADDDASPAVERKQTLPPDECDSTTSSTTYSHYQEESLADLPSAMSILTRNRIVSQPRLTAALSQRMPLDVSSEEADGRHENSVARRRKTVESVPEAEVDPFDASTISTKHTDYQESFELPPRAMSSTVATAKSRLTAEQQHSQRTPPPSRPIVVGRKSSTLESVAEIEDSSDSSTISSSNNAGDYHHEVTSSPSSSELPSAMAILSRRNIVPRSLAGEMSKRSLYSEHTVPTTPAAPRPSIDERDDVRRIAGRDAVVIVHAPPGRMGLALDATAGDGRLPVVRAVNGASVVAGEVRVGDRLLAIDDVSVASTSSIWITKMLVDKMDQPTRKLTILRTVDF